MGNCNFIAPSTAQAIEDAILFGHVGELDAVLARVAGDRDFPEELRHGLEALRYFREYYGKGGVLEPKTHMQRQKAMIVENAWGSEMLGLLSREEEAMQRRLA